MSVRGRTRYMYLMVNSRATLLRETQYRTPFCRRNFRHTGFFDRPGSMKHNGSYVPYGVSYVLNNTKNAIETSVLW